MLGTKGELMGIILLIILILLLSGHCPRGRIAQDGATIRVVV
jgi:hypothetical protein